MKPKIAFLPGDGIGPEVTRAALRVLEACVPYETREALVGGAAIDATGDPLPPETVALCQESEAVFLGAVGGPKWENGAVRPEQGLLRLRKALDVYANLRPARYLGLPTPLNESLVRQADLLVVRELSGGVYFGEPRFEKPEEAVDTWRQTREEVRRVAHVAFKLARRRRKLVTSVDKANVLACSRLWRRVVVEIAAEYPDVVLEHRYVDAASFEILRVPHKFDVILTDNLFGDILSDEAAAIAGSIGVLPSASLGPGPGPLRADPRRGARHRRQGHREPDRSDPDDRAHARARLPPPADGARGREGDGGGAAGGAHTRHRRPRHHHRAHRRRAAQPRLVPLVERHRGGGGGRGVGRLDGARLGLGRPLLAREELVVARERERGGVARRGRRACAGRRRSAVSRRTAKQ